MKQTTKRDAAYYEKKAKDLRAKEDRKKEIQSHKDALKKLTGKKT